MLGVQNRGELILSAERNQVEPQGSTIRKLAAALDVEPEKLVKAED